MTAMPKKSKPEPQPMTLDNPPPPMAANIADGWRTRFLPGGRMVMVHPDHMPRIVDLKTVKSGETLPRDVDEELSFPPSLGGK